MLNLLLLLALCAPPQDTTTDEEELVEPKSFGEDHQTFATIELLPWLGEQWIELTVHSWGESPIEEEAAAARRSFTAFVESSPAFFAGARFDQTRIEFGQGEHERVLRLSFEVTEAAAEASSGELVFVVRAEDDEVLPRERRFILAFEIGVQEEPSLEVYAVREDAPEDFEIADALDHCALDVSEVHQYDRAVVFFTPERDFSGIEEFQWRILNPRGRTCAAGSLRQLDTEDEEDQEGERRLDCDDLTREGSPGLLATELDLWERTLPEDPERRMYGPGTYTLESVRLKRVPASAVFGQGGYNWVPDGEWQLEGTFEVLDAQLHFQGFVTESLTNAALPESDWLWSGTCSIEKLRVEAESGAVELTLGARWRRTERQPDGELGPADEEKESTTRLRLTYPTAIVPGETPTLRGGMIWDELLDPVAEVEVTREFEGDEYIQPIPCFFRPVPTRGTPDRALVEGDFKPEPWDGYAGVGAEEGALVDLTRGKDDPWPEGGERGLFKLCVCDDEPFGSPPRTLPWLLHDEGLRWVFPVKLPIAGDLSLFGFAVYGAKAEPYDGPQPMAPDRPAGERERDPTVDPLDPGIDVADLPPTAGDPGAEDPPTAEDPGGDPGGRGDDPSGRTGERTAADPGGRTPAGRTTSDPAAMNPDADPELAGFIREWIAVAEPPQNATIGADLHYTQWGVMVGTVPGGVITERGPPDASAGHTPEAYTWSLRDQLDSVDHCLLGEYVLARLMGDSIAHCRGRYKPKSTTAVGDYGGKPLTSAKDEAMRDGLTVDVVLGDPAPTPEEAFTVRDQKPDPGVHVPVGGKVRIEVHGPAVGAVARQVPEVWNLSLREAKERLEAIELVADPIGGDPARTPEKAFMVYHQSPSAGTQLAPGGKVKVWVHGPYEPCVVPDVTGLAVEEAEQRLRDAGLGAEPLEPEPAASAGVAHTVHAQDPAAGAEVPWGTDVRLKRYGAHAAVPPTPPTPPVEQTLTGPAWKLRGVERLDHLSRPLTQPSPLSTENTGRRAGSYRRWTIEPGELRVDERYMEDGHVLTDWILRCAIPAPPAELRAGQKFDLRLEGTTSGHGGATPYSIAAHVHGDGIRVEPAGSVPVTGTSLRSHAVSYAVTVSERPPDRITLAVGAMNAPGYVRWTYEREGLTAEEEEEVPAAAFYVVPCFFAPALEVEDETLSEALARLDPLTVKWTAVDDAAGILRVEGAAVSTYPRSRFQPGVRFALPMIAEYVGRESGDRRRYELVMLLEVAATGNSLEELESRFPEEIAAARKPDGLLVFASRDGRLEHRFEDEESSMLGDEPYTGTATVGPIEWGWSPAMKRACIEGLRAMAIDFDCFLASCAYAGVEAPALDSFRRLRDEVLVRSAAGRRLIRRYERIGPVLANRLRAAPELRPVVRALLDELATSLDSSDPRHVALLVVLLDAVLPKPEALPPDHLRHFHPLVPNTPVSIVPRASAGSDPR